MTSEQCHLLSLSGLRLVSMVDFELAVTLPLRYLFNELVRSVFHTFQLASLVLHFLLLIMGLRFCCNTLVTSIYNVKFFCLRFLVTDTFFKS